MTTTAFTIAVLFGAVVVTALIYLLIRKFGKRETSNVCTLINLTLILCFAIYEIGIRFVNSKSTFENPWFLESGNLESSGHPDLPYQRTPNIDWYGYANGDLATLNKDIDPYEQRVKYGTDQDGFRNAEQVEKADMVFIGDSYTEAGNINIEKTFASLIPNQLNIKGKNLGVSGYSTPEEFITLREEGIRVKPKTVVFQIAESNDVIECVRYFNWVKNGKPKVDFRNNTPNDFPTWKRLSLAFKLHQWLAGPILNPYKLQGHFTDQNNEEWLIRLLKLPNLNMTSANQIGWQLVQENLLNAKMLCTQNQIELLVILVPDKSRVLGPKLKLNGETERQLSASINQYSRNSLASSLAQFSNEN